MAKIERAEINSDSEYPVGEGKGAAVKADVVCISRRRALIAGLAATPVIVSLMNRSSWAQPNPAYASCALIASYHQANYQWTSPRPSNQDGQLAFTVEEYNNCGIPPDPNP